MPDFKPTICIDSDGLIHSYEKGWQASPTGAAPAPVARVQDVGEVMTKEVLAWHFVGATLHDGSPIPADGILLEHAGELVMCESGLHASERLIDALHYARGATICRVECGGQIKRDTDKLVASRRTILWRVNETEILRTFARQCALDVAHLWDMPDVVRQYLETGDESLRAAAWAAASAAASAAAWAAWAAASAARDAASAAASDADWAAGAAASAARAAARSAARAAASAARDAASAAASAADWAAWAAAREAAWAAASATQNKRLTALVEAQASQLRAEPV